MTNGYRSGFGLVLVLCAVACDVDSGGHAGDAGADAANDMIVNADNNPFPCLNPVPSEGRSGFFTCDNGLSIRPRPVRCPASGQTMSPDECETDADCSGGYCGCASEHQTVNQCFGGRDGDCQSDRDCMPGFHCGFVIIGYSDWAIYHMRCQLPGDECATADDCLAGLDAGSVPMSDLACQANQAGRFCDLTGW